MKLNQNGNFFLPLSWQLYSTFIQSFSVLINLFTAAVYVCRSLVLTVIFTMLKSQEQRYKIQIKFA